MSKVRASAKVRLLVEVKQGSAWGENCTVGQVQSQAASAASAAVTKAICNAGAMRVVSVEGGYVSIEAEP